MLKERKMLTNRDFSCAIKALKIGKKIRREGTTYTYYIDPEFNKVVCSFTLNDFPFFGKDATFNTDDVMAMNWMIVD
jgi:UDP:flavonoid glycosyltransferase YjiC (YdhE family)